MCWILMLLDVALGVRGHESCWHVLWNIVWLLKRQPCYNYDLSALICTGCSYTFAANVSGVVINSCGWVRGGGYQSLIHVSGAFEGKSTCVLHTNHYKSSVWWLVSDYFFLFEAGICNTISSFKWRTIHISRKFDQLSIYHKLFVHFNATLDSLV